MSDHARANQWYFHQRRPDQPCRSSGARFPAQFQRTRRSLFPRAMVSMTPIEAPRRHFPNGPQMISVSISKLVSPQNLDLRIRYIVGRILRTELAPFYHSVSLIGRFSAHAHRLLKTCSSKVQEQLTQLLYTLYFKSGFERNPWRISARRSSRCALATVG